MRNGKTVVDFIMLTLTYLKCLTLFNGSNIFKWIEYTTILAISNIGFNDLMTLISVAMMRNQLRGVIHP